MKWQDVEKIIEEATNWQKKRVLNEARRHIPHLTPEDILQPNDYPELENDPEFRYEEGILCGMQTLATTLRTGASQQECHSCKIT